MGQHPDSTEHGDLDLVAGRLAAELGLTDLAELSALIMTAAETQFDEDIAFNRQLELYEDTIRTIDDHETAEILSHAIDQGSWPIESISEQAAQDDRAAALALSNTGQLPPRSEAQRLLDRPILQEPPSLEGRYGSTEKNLIAPSLEESQYQATLDRVFSESISTQAAQDDWRAAIALSNTGQLPPRSEAQRLMDRLIMQEPPSLEGRYGSTEKDSVAQSLGESQYQDSTMFKEGLRYGERPRYMRYNYWGENDAFLKTLADWSETAQALPSPPEAELRNPVVLKTVTTNPHLFKVATPIRVDIFQRLLIDHPNLTFVTSVCKGLREGFWPFADTYIGKYPEMHDGSLGMPRKPAEAKFLRDQRDIEIDKGRFSRSFGKDLLPGMYSSPIHVVPKRGTSDFRLITDHSSGKYPLNSMINYEDIAGMPLDDMRHLGEKLLTAYARGRKLTLWKSDVSEAYRNCPMHPHWQIKQVNTIDGERYIDRNNTFGSRASFKIWGSVNSLVMWIAEHMCKIDRPFCYNDDAFGVCDADYIDFYEPYMCQMPRDQCRLLELWDMLGIPHKEKKQLSGPTLTIIGIEVDANRMTMTLPADGKAALIKELHRFIARPNGKPLAFTLKEFQRLAGRMNAALNVFPLLRPVLANIFHTVREVDRNNGGSNNQILCNTAIRDDLIWGLKHIQTMDGVRLLEDARAWKPKEADITLYTSSKHTLSAYWYPTDRVGYYFNVTPSASSDHELFLSALCVASAFRDAAYRGRSSSKIVIYTDNLGTVKMFNSFHCTPVYNHFLKAVADIMIEHKYKLKVLHTSAKENVVANLISQGSFDEAYKLAPGLKISLDKHSNKLLGV